MQHIKNHVALEDRHTLVIKRFFPVTVETLWEAVATQAGLERWFMAPRQEIEPGGWFSFFGGWEGRVTKYEPGFQIEFTPAESGGAFLRFEIATGKGGCTFRLIDRLHPERVAAAMFPGAPNHQIHQPGGAGTHWSGILAGYHGFIDALEYHLTGHGPRHDYDDLCRAYAAVQDDWFRSPAVLQR